MKEENLEEVQARMQHKVEEETLQENHEIKTNF